jgi:hypothetical protein
VEEDTLEEQLSGCGQDCSRRGPEDQRWLEVGERKRSSIGAVSFGGHLPLRIILAKSKDQRMFLFGRVMTQPPDPASSRSFPLSLDFGCALYCVRKGDRRFQ